jgi:hypothetical protein
MGLYLRSTMIQMSRTLTGRAPTIRDAGLVERRLEKLGFDLVLHGHKHKPQLRETLVHALHVRIVVVSQSE